MNEKQKTIKQLLEENGELKKKLEELQRKNSVDVGQYDDYHSDIQFSELFKRTVNGVALHEIILDDLGNPVDYRFLEVNDAFEKHTGLVAEEILGEKVTEVIPGIEDTQFIEIYGKVALTGESVLFEQYAEPAKKHFEINAYSPKTNLFVSILRDITKYKKTEKELKENEQRYRSFFEKGPLGILVAKANSDIVEVNDLACKLLGYSEDEIIGKKMSAFIHPDDHDMVAKKIINAMETSQPDFSIENRFIKKSGEVIWVNQTSALLLDERGIPTLGMAIIEDITRRKLLEDTIRSLATDLPKTYGKNFFDKVSNYLSDSLQVDFVFVGELNEQKTKVNVIGGMAHGQPMESFDYDLANTPCDNVMGKKICVYDSKVQELFPKDQLLIDMGIEGYIGYPLIDSNNKALGIIVVLHSQAISNPEMIESMVSIFGERTANEIERMNTQIKLEESEERFHSLSESTFEGIGVSKEGKIIDVNHQLSEMFGYERGEMIGLSPIELVHPDDHEYLRDQTANNPLAIYEVRGLKKNGTEIILEGRGRSELQKGESVRISAFRDVTKSKRAEQLLNAFNQAAVDMGAAMTGREIFDAVANQLNKLGISCMLITLDGEKGMLNTEYVSYDSKAIKKIEKLVDLSSNKFTFPFDNIPLYKDVIEEKKTLYSNNTEKILAEGLPKDVKKFSKRLVEILKAKTGIYAPITVENEVIGIFSLQSNNLTEGDIQAATAFSYQLSDAWEKTILIKNLQKTVRGTIDTIAAMVEARDPYTAGHQARVSDLAVAIATEMGLSNNEIEGIRLASLVHDLGKINVPAEILSKPGKISALEYEIIKTHSQIGFDLLKDTDFSLPIAKTILQHHEKIDGSGYPQGLVGEEILIEARILTVADVVEAISSHRPYRPALGVNTALEQIKKDRGTLFDKEVVDACLKIFKQGYNLPAFLN